MDESVLERAKRHVDDARDGRGLARFEAGLEHARREVEALAAAAAAVEASLPERVERAVADGLRSEVQTIGRALAEIRGLVNNAVRRLDRLEQDLLAERHARIDDLALLVDLVSTGWRGVDERLRGLERPAPRATPVVPPASQAAA